MEIIQPWERIIVICRNFKSQENIKMRTYLVKIRFKGSVSWVQVQARDGGQAKALVRAQYGDTIDVLEAKPA